MNIKFKRIGVLFVCMCVLTSVCFASGALLSPALKHIEKQIGMKKCSLNGQAVYFEAEDFDEVFCTEVEFIKLEELPDSSQGALCIGSLRTGENQIVERKDLDRLVFHPENAACGTVSFVFSNASAGESDVSAVCTVYMLEEENKSPYAENMSVSTYENVAVFKFLNVSDPENDELSFEVVAYPNHGTLRISEGSDGHFSYTPVKGYTGKDCFEYTVSDSYGNVSKPAKVNVKVSDNGNSVYFDDLSGHWAHNSAITSAAMGLMTGVDGEGGAFNFRPGDTVTRGDFLAMALISADKEKDIRFVTQTSFADDADIPMNIKSYAEYAKRCGIVTGYEADNGERVFDSTSAITRAEAAVILDRILMPEADGGDISVFADSREVPGWAASSVARLTKCGVLNGTGFGELMPASYVTRAETAELLCNVRAYVMK